VRTRLGDSRRGRGVSLSALPSTTSGERLRGGNDTWPSSSPTTS
jgi:hypothetical protein